MKTLRQQESSGAGGASAAKKQKTGNSEDNEEEPQVADAAAVPVLLQQEPVPIQSFSSSEQRVWRSICRELDFLENQEVDQNDRNMHEERVRRLFDEQIEKYPQLTQIHSEETACLLQRVLATNDTSKYLGRDTHTVARDHCTEDYSRQVIKNLIKKNPSALLWPQVKNWTVGLENQILTWKSEPIITIVTREPPSLIIWLLQTYPSLLEFEWRSQTKTIGDMVAREMIGHGSADTISSFLQDFPSILAQSNEIPIYLLSRLRVSFYQGSFDIRTFESIMSTLKWVERTSPESIVSNLYEVLRELAWSISLFCTNNREKVVKDLFEVARFFVRRYPLSLIRNDEKPRLYRLLIFLRKKYQYLFPWCQQPRPLVVKYLIMVLRLLHSSGFDIQGILDAERSSYLSRHPTEHRQDLEDFHKARNLVDLICQEGQISRELGRLRLAAAKLQSSKQHSDVAEVFQAWSKTRSDVAFSSHARVKAIRGQMAQLRFE